nr:MAG TPA: hypothetical protein [Caudoviricetes sp.]
MFNDYLLVRVHYKCNGSVNENDIVSSIQKCIAVLL